MNAGQFIDQRYDEEERKILIEELILHGGKIIKNDYLEKRTYWVTMLSHPKSP